MTGSDLIQSALRLLGVPSSVAPGTSALSVLNELLASWSAERINVYSMRRETFALQAGVQTYTIGAAGSFNTTRPVKIERAAVVLSGTRYPLEIIDEAGWQRVKEDDVTALLPVKVYDDYNYPLSTLYFWPKPSGTPTFEVFSWRQLGSIATLATDFDLPPGYEQAVRYNLAVMFAPEFAKPVTPEIAAEAGRSRQAIAGLNVGGGLPAPPAGPAQ